MQQKQQQDSSKPYRFRAGEVRQGVVIYWTVIGTFPLFTKQNQKKGQSVNGLQVYFSLCSAKCSAKCSQLSIRVCPSTWLPERKTTGFYKLVILYVWQKSIPLWIFAIAVIIFYLKYWFRVFHFVLEVQKYLNFHHFFIRVLVRFLSPWIVTSNHYLELGTPRSMGSLQRLSCNWE